MKNEELKSRIHEIKDKLSPLFKINKNTLEKFQSPIIIRDYEKKDYDRIDKSAPGYDALRNLLYFPNEQNFNFKEKDKYPALIKSITYESIFNEEEIIPFISSYIHHQINPNLRKFALEIELNKDDSEFVPNKKTAKYHSLRAIVMEYPNMILRNRSIYDSNIRKILERTFHLFIDKGPEFLPELSRMSVEEASKKGILNYTPQPEILE